MEGSSLLSAAHSWRSPPLRTHTAEFYGTDTDTELALKLNASRTLAPIALTLSLSGSIDSVVGNLRSHFTN